MLTQTTDHYADGISGVLLADVHMKQIVSDQQQFA